MQKKFRKKDIPNINYGIIHSQFGYSDGVSIVMRQVEEVMKENLNIPKQNIFYLLGKCPYIGKKFTKRKVLWHKSKINVHAQLHFSEGFGGKISEDVENAIREAKEEITLFVKKNNIQVLIVHNASHPVNFISSVALSRFYRDEINAGKKTPKYILWWHDSHLERTRFANPSVDMKRYLFQGVPGRFVEYIIYINSLQFGQTEHYFAELNKSHQGLYDAVIKNHSVIYNTVDTCINTFEDLQHDTFSERTELFFEKYKFWKLIKLHNLTLKDVQFCLQHTRIVPRKRIDFALEYAFSLFDELKRKKLRKAMYFFISGHHGDEFGNYKKDLKKLHKDLLKKYNTDKFFLVFAEDFKKTGIQFEEFPNLFARLGGISTYFSEIEGFGNNLLEVLSGGLIPVVYTYPVFKKDIAKFRFKLVALDFFEISKKSIDEIIKVIKSDKLKKEYADKNITILKKKFSHDLIAWKLKRAIIRQRTHG